MGNRKNNHNKGGRGGGSKDKKGNKGNRKTKADATSSSSEQEVEIRQNLGIEDAYHNRESQSPQQQMQNPGKGKKRQFSQTELAR